MAPDPNSVSLLGLGAMGAALARALLRGGHDVTVWNRTASKAKALESEGAKAAATPGDAISASAVTFFVVVDADQTLAILDAFAQLAKDRTLVQLSTGTADDARKIQSRCNDLGARYLEGKLLFYPDQAGTSDAFLPVCGPTDVYAAAEPFFKSLGAPDYLGDGIGKAAATDHSLLSLAMSMLVGTVHAARMCEAEGLPLERLIRGMGSLETVLLPELRSMVQRIEKGNFGDTHAALGTYYFAVEKTAKQARAAGVKGNFLGEIEGLLKKGVNMGLGDEDMAALIKVLR
ncbi:beta-hydroxyacid dehydrogenase [Hyaloraphidium curvatum]|nr:beta-hydroxyacid dehydrogenase [Hyaloraphidium curvatum]